MRQSMHGPRRRMVHRPDTVSIHITREGRRTSGPESLIISKFPVRKSRSRKSRSQRWLALVRQSKWTPTHRHLYWKGLFDRRRVFDQLYRAKNIIRDFYKRKNPQKSAFSVFSLLSKIPYNIFTRGT